MAKKVDNRTFNVSVVGLSGTEKEKGADGIGKSCLCNRFMHPLADDYYKDHISVLSQSDFGGRVVNNDHFLYWGEVSKTDEGIDFIFNIAEQTEFIDDSSFQPFKSGKPEPYIKRCSSIRLQSAEKLMYICKNQLGLEHEFEQRMLPEGKLTVDGFLCLFDVSIVHQRSFPHQVEHTVHLLQNLRGTKKPIVFVTTKNDAAHEPFMREAEKIASKLKVQIVETSSHDNINVEMAFLALAHQIDRTKGRLKIVPFAEASRARREVLDVALEAYQLLLRTQVTDYKALWIPVHRKLTSNADYNHFVDLFGTDRAKKLFREHVRQLREEFLQQRQEQYLDQLRGVLKRILPDLSIIADRSWPSTMRWIQRQDYFDQCFINIPDGGSWQDPDYIESIDDKIPFDLLDSNEADNCFRDHVNLLRLEHKRSELRKQFKQLLNHNHNVCPGKSLSDVAIFFLGRECFSNLTEEDKQSVYEQHQSELKDKARQDFIELLLENSELFARYDAQTKITTDDLRDINERLRSEPRYQALSRLEDDRQAMLLNHLSFVQCPSRERCPFRDHCMESLVERLLATKAHRPQSWSNNSHFLLDSGDYRLNLVLLGTEGLARQLAQEIRLHCVDDDQYLLDNQLYSLDYRPLDGDVSLPQNSFRTTDFLPHGCFCVYNSVSSLEYLRESLEKTLMSDLEREDRLPFQGLPIAIVLAHDPGLSEKGLLTLRVEGQSLADRLQCPFIDIPSAMMEGTDLKFHKDQIELAMHALIESIKHRSSFVKPWQIAESIEPDIRILMCFMCGDEFNIELPLAPLLNHQCCYVTSDKYPTITLETYLDDSKRKVEVTILSYHGASMVQDELYHGYILVYSPNRKAALTTLKSFSSSLPKVPVKVLAVTESGGANAFFSSEFSQGLLTEGNALADKLNASFMTTCPNFQQQTASYTPFFKDAWDRKSDTESAFQFSGDEMAHTLTLERQECDKLFERFIKRPPATLPKPPRRFDSFTASKGSTSNSQSTEDSEPVYDTPRLDGGSESDDGDGASSASPGDLSPYHTGGDEVYSEIAPRDTEQLIKPSQVKSRRNMYANTGWSEDPSYDATVPLLSQMENPAYDTTSKPSPPPPPPIFPKPRGPIKVRPPKITQPLDQAKYQDVARVLNRNISTANNSQLPLVKAPLATPEAIEIGDYAQVRDAVSPAENDYALVHDALPAGKMSRVRSTFRKKQDKGDAGAGSDSDSEFSSLERERKKEDIYSRVNRRPTPHKKKHKPRYSDSNLPPPPLPPFSEERHLLVAQDQLEKGSVAVRSNSPSEGSEGTGDEEQNSKKQKKRRSFRTKKKKPLDSEGCPVASPPWSDSDLGVPGSSRGLIQEDDTSYDGTREYGSPGRYGDDTEELVEPDGSYWLKKLKLKSEKDPDKMKRKEEKKAKEDERRKVKEEEKRQKEQQKLQRKMRKKDGKGPPSQSSLGALEDMVQSEEHLLPLFVIKCVTFIQEEGLSVEGIYRVPGNKAHVDLLMEKFKEDPNVDIKSLDIPVNAVATALKGFFSDLAEPLVPSRFHDELIEAASIRDKSSRIFAIRDVARKLPKVNWHVLNYLVDHINVVTEHSTENSMDSKNLAICWWPTLLRPEFTSFEKMTMVSKYLEEIIQCVIDQSGFFFRGESEV